MGEIAYGVTQWWLLETFKEHNITNERSEMVANLQTYAYSNFDFKKSQIGQVYFNKQIKREHNNSLSIAWSSQLLYDSLNV